MVLPAGQFSVICPPSSTPPQTSLLVATTMAFVFSGIVVSVDSPVQAAPPRATLVTRIQLRKPRRADRSVTACFMRPPLCDGVLQNAETAMNRWLYWPGSRRAQNNANRVG